MVNRPELVPQALQRFRENKAGVFCISAGCPRNYGYIASFNCSLARSA